MQMITDPQRARRSDPGDPDVCNVYAFHQLYTDSETRRQIDSQCRKAEIGCVECKRIMAENLVQALGPLQEKRQYYLSHPEIVEEIMIEGSRKARQIAAETLRQAKAALRIDY
jgi:tryptophanyl-tRNA synthetase